MSRYDRRNVSVMNEKKEKTLENEGKESSRKGDERTIYGENWEEGRDLSS